MTENKFNKLPDDNINTFKKSNIDQYINRPNALVGEGKCSALDNEITCNESKRLAH